MLERQVEEAVATFPYFEVLLKTSRLSGTSLSAEMLAYRTYPDSSRTVH